MNINETVEIKKDIYFIGANAVPGCDCGLLALLRLSHGNGSKRNRSKVPHKSSGSTQRLDN